MNECLNINIKLIIKNNLAFQLLGIVMAIQIAMAEKTNRRINVKLKIELALEIFSLATMATAYLEFMFVMVIMIVLTTLMRVKIDSVKIALVILKLNLHAKLIAIGKGLFVLKKIG